MSYHIGVATSSCKRKEDDYRPHDVRHMATVRVLTLLYTVFAAIVGLIS